MDRRLLLALPLVALLGYLAWARPPASTARLLPAGPEALAAHLRGAVDRGDLPGVVALVVSRDGVLYQGAFGKQNTALDIDMREDAIFRIASMTKPLTSIAVMMLVDEGRVGLDDDVARYVPELARPQVLTAYDEAAGTFETAPADGPITIRQLLTHTSGIAYAFSNPALAFYQKVTGVGDPLKQPLVHHPGARWTYGASTRVLGLVVEQVSGQRIDRFLEARIHGPLGMVDTSFEVPRAKYPRVATTRQRTEDGAFSETQNPETLPATVQGDGGLYSTAADYGRFLQMLLGDGQAAETRLLGPGLVAQIASPHTGPVLVETQPSTNPALSRPFPVGAGADAWGLGFQITAAASTGPGRRSPGSYAWAGIFNTHFWVDPARGIGVVFLTQVLPFYDERVMQAMEGFEELVYRHLE